MKQLFILFILSVTVHALPAQQKAYAKGSSQVSAGYGFINVWKEVFKQVSSTTTAVGPVALKYEYGFSNRISGGLLLGYSVVTNKFNFTSYTSTQKLYNISALAIANYHFGRPKKFDPYIGANFGYYNFRYTQKSSNPAIIIPADSEPEIPAAIGFAGQAGVKYYVTPHYAAFVEAGYISGAVIMVGATFKL